MNTAPSRHWLLLIAALNTLLSFATGRLPPYFGELLWRGLYLFIAISIIIFYFIPTRKWLLRASSLITSAGFLRGISFFVYDQRIAAFCLNLNIVILTWAFYKLRAPHLRRG